MQGLNFGIEGLALQIAGDLDAREDQYVVVGKAGLEGPNKALILILKAKVVD